MIDPESVIAFACGFLVLFVIGLALSGKPRKAAPKNFDDRMGAGRARFVLNESTLWHLRNMGERLKPGQEINISREVIVPDCSKWQALIDFLKMKLAGAAGVILKAGQGTAEDPMFRENWRKAKEAGLARGTYFFYDSRVHPRIQARKWWEIIQADTGELKHYADFEENYGGPYAGWKSLKEFIAEFKFLSGLPDEKIGIYSSFYYWIANSPTVASELAFFARFRLWLAWYANPSVVIIPRPWTMDTLDFWQYTASGDGTAYGVSSKEIDLSNFNGDAKNYRLYFGLTEPLPPSDGGNMQIIQGESLGSVTRRKTKAGEGFYPARYLMIGDQIEADRNEYQWLHLTKINGVALTEEEWASAGSQQQYIKWGWVEVSTEPPPVEPPADDVITGSIDVDVSLTLNGVQYGATVVIGEVRLSKR